MTATIQNNLVKGGCGLTISTFLNLQFAEYIFEKWSHLNFGRIIFLGQKHIQAPKYVLATEVPLHRAHSVLQKFRNSEPTCSFLSANIKDMTGKGPNIFFRFCLPILSPILLLGIWGFSIFDYKEPTYGNAVSYIPSYFYSRAAASLRMV